EASKNITEDVWNTVEEIQFYNTVCYAAVNKETIIKCFPEYVVSDVISKSKSQLALNGNTYLWRVQQIQIELLEEFDRICRKHGLSYNISFGTLLGAVRHKGFIPWDDDIDVTLPWEDFNRLDEVMKFELDEEKYYYRCPSNEANNHLIFKHLERKGTVYTKPGRDKLKQQIGVFIDIFPMYPSAPFAMLDWFHAKICRYWRTALWATVGADSEPDERKRKYYKKIARVGNKKCYEKFVNAATFFKNEKYLKFWIAMDRNPYKVPLVRMSNYTDVIEVDFEGRKFMAPRNYEQVLDYCFGHDWRMYPSTRGRLPLHNAIMEIGNLYEEESEELK
ncbi:MAG: LicD family protein, partial [Bacillota bacterium]|nr:LicD family protein [Bacillota bacterium]